MRTVDLDRPETPWEKLDRFQRSQTGHGQALLSSPLSYSHVCRAVDGHGVSLHTIVVSSADSIPLSMGSSGHERFKWRFANEIKAATVTFLKSNDNQDMNQEIQRSTPSVFDDENLIELSEQV